MSVDFQLTDNISHLISQMKKNESKALKAIGLSAVEITTDYMNHRYGKAIYDTGDLIRDVNFKVDPSSSSVAVGNSLNYATWVHNGTRRMPARPYLKDAIMENGDVFSEVAMEQLKSGF